MSTATGPRPERGRGRVLQVVQVKTRGREGYTAVQLGCGSKRDKQLHSGLRGHFRAAGVTNKRKLAEFRVTEDALLPVGTRITAAHFVPGQFVDVSGTTIGVPGALDVFADGVVVVHRLLAALTVSRFRCQARGSRER